MAKKTGFGAGANSSGQGGKGTAPYSRGPTVAAVKPTGTRNPNGMGAQGKAQTGGGEGSRSHTKIAPVGGSPSTRKVSPYGAAHLWRQRWKQGDG
jgi:hypothetical protein